MTALRRVIVFLVLLAAIGCSQRGLDTRFDFDSRVGAGADLAQVKTWNWVPKQYLPTGDPRIDDPVFLDRLEKLVEGELAARGLEKTSDGPDFVINYEVGISTTFDEANWVNSYSQETFSNNDTNWEEGNLTILFVNAETGQVMWAGWGKGEIDENASKSQRNDNLRKIVERIFARFDADRTTPPPAAKDYNAE
ncbi:MAG: DUF4136 domain-containing protein [Candidatus Krumholzibacteriota bacterium]|nr:DUF4136 domain-containing protein [Candidatus Krumholzibacteriota bacterium]